ncbi:MAG: hypothetical protein QXR71_03075 [Candidatus Aenigmatarchaeota archaeon]
MGEQKLERLEEEICKLREEIISIKKMIAVVKGPIIIEKIDEKDLTKKERRLMKEALRDFKAGKRDKFATL